jgi:hypothetical protein
VSSYFDVAGRNIALARSILDGSIGVQISFSHRSGVAVTLNGKIISDRVELVREGMIETEQRVLTMRIATGQTGFTAPGDASNKMTYLGRTWSALNPVGKDKFGRTYTVKWVEDKRLNSGA